ncbi:hypothetical protein, partial [Cyclobacterium roseum]|uniref:hypothetical protein n=1 Tax=Cyclobacterium roseum TaxID=2666137 RepID=UPI001F1CF6AE
AKQSDPKRNRKSSVEYHPKTTDGHVLRQTAAGAQAIMTIRLGSICTLPMTYFYHPLSPPPENRRGLGGGDLMSLFIFFNILIFK